MKNIQEKYQKKPDSRIASRKLQSATSRGANTKIMCVNGLTSKQRCRYSKLANAAAVAAVDRSASSHTGPISGEKYTDLLR